MNTDLHYVTREPKIASDQPPVLILLHGYGSHELDLFSFAEELPDEFLIFSLRAPYDIGYGGYAWYALNLDTNDNKFSDLNQARESLVKIATFIDEVKGKYSPEKIFLLGFSQGAILSYSVNFNYPNKVDHIVALSGYVNHDMFPEVKDRKSNTDFYVSHGSVDQVIPIGLARKTPPFLESLSIEHVYEEYPVGHGVAPQNFYSFKKWIEERL